MRAAASTGSAKIINGITWTSPPHNEGGKDLLLKRNHGSQENCRQRKASSLFSRNSAWRAPTPPLQPSAVPRRYTNLINSKSCTLLLQSCHTISFSRAAPHFSPPSSLVSQTCFALTPFQPIHPQVSSSTDLHHCHAPPPPWQDLPLEFPIPCPPLPMLLPFFQLLPFPVNIAKPLMAVRM